jgi:hypothetical protein
MTGGDAIDAESLTVAATPVKRERVQIAGATDVEIARVSNAPFVLGDYGLATRRIIDRATALTTLHANITIDNAPLFDNSALQDVDSYTDAMLYLSITRSAAPPTKFILTPEFSDDAGTTWFTDDAQAMEFSDWTKIVNGSDYDVVRRIKLWGRDMRTVMTGEGLDATHTITATIVAEWLSL